MFLRPSRLAYAPIPDEDEGHAKRKRPSDAERSMSLLVNEMNHYYRLGDGAWSVRTKYMTFAENDVDNQLWYNLATETLTLTVGVRWWDTAGEQLAGVPLVPPAGREDDVYCLADGAWHPEAEVPTVTVGMIEAAFPYVMDKKYR